MEPASPVTRRLLLRRFTAGTSVFGTFLLPPALHDAMAAQHQASQFPLLARRAPTAEAAKPPRPLVMLDPGHGGKDPGAIGVSGTYEKQVALATALELKRQLESGGRYRVELTRTRDVFIPLDGRVDLAQKRGAALFVSMHADALVGPFGAWSVGLYAGADSRRMCRPPPWPAPRIAPTGLLAGNGRAPRLRYPRSLPAWCDRKPGWAPCGLPGGWSAAWIRICRCCRIPLGTPDS